MIVSNIKKLVLLTFCIVLVGVISGCGGSQESGRTEPGSNLQTRFDEGRKAYDEGRYMDAIRIFEEVRIQAPASELASQATYMEGMARYKQEQFSAAAVDFRSLRRNNPGSPLAGRAQYMVGESYYQLSPRPELDQTYTLYAQTEYQSFLRDFPRAEQTLIDRAQQRITDIRNKLAQKVLLSAELYVKIEEPKSAMVYFERVLDQYYDTKPAAEAQLRIAELSYSRKKYDDAKTALGKFDDKYLSSASPEQRQRALALKAKL